MAAGAKTYQLIRVAQIGLSLEVLAFELGRVNQHFGRRRLACERRHGPGYILSMATICRLVSPMRKRENSLSCRLVSPRAKREVLSLRVGLTNRRRANETDVGPMMTVLRGIPVPGGADTNISKKIAKACRVCQTSFDALVEQELCSAEVGRDMSSEPLIKRRYCDEIHGYRQGHQRERSWRHA